MWLLNHYYGLPAQLTILYWVKHYDPLDVLDWLEQAVTLQFSIELSLSPLLFRVAGIPLPHRGLTILYWVKLDKEMDNLLEDAYKILQFSIELSA